MMEIRANADGGNCAHDAMPNPYWWERLFRTIDAGDSAAFVDYLTPDAQFRFGNAPMIQGASEIAAAITVFFGSIRSSQHQLHESWSQNNAAGCEGEVIYTRHDGAVVTFPFANVFRLRDQKISSYHIYIDISTLFTTS